MCRVESIAPHKTFRHILEAIDTIETSRLIHPAKKAEKDPIVFWGFVKHVEIIGEAVYMLSPEFKAAHPEMDWVSIEGMRHVLAHGYYHIKPKQLWDTIDIDLPELKPSIEKFLEELEKEDA